MNSLETVSIDVDEALRYMGTPPHRAGEALCTLVTRCAGEVAAAACPRWSWRVFDLCVEEEGVRLAGGLLLPGRDLKRHLSDCRQAAVFCATLGAQVDALIRRAECTDMLRALALDGCASAAVEQLCDRIEAQLHSRFPGCHFTFRYSPGYGDLPLEVNTPLLAELDGPRRAGLCATASHTLVPRKSVTAILGVAQGPVESYKRSCLDCPARNGCQYRKSGGHCGIS